MQVLHSWVCLHWLGEIPYGIATLYAIPYGFGAAVSTKVSNELGAGNPQGAHVAVLAVTFLAIAELYQSAVHDEVQCAQRTEDEGFLQYMAYMDRPEGPSIFLGFPVFCIFGFVMN